MDAESAVNPPEKKGLTTKQIVFGALIAGAIVVIVYLIVSKLAPSGTPIIIKGDDSGPGSSPLQVSFNAYDGTASSPAAEPPAAGEHPVAGNVLDVKLKTTENCMVYRLGSSPNFRLTVFSTGSNKEIELFNDLSTSKIKSVFTDSAYSGPLLVDNPTGNDEWRYGSSRRIETVKFETDKSSSCTDKNNATTPCLAEFPDPTHWPSVANLQITINAGVLSCP